MAAVVFYRALLQSATLEPVDALIEALRQRGVNPLPIYCTSLKEPVAADTIVHLLREAGAGLVLNATGFAVAAPGTTGRPPSAAAQSSTFCGGRSISGQARRS